MHLGTLAGSPAILSVPILQPCLRAELLLVTVDTHTGMLQCHVPQYDAPLVPELTTALNGDHSRLPTLISELRYKYDRNNLRAFILSYSQNELIDEFFCDRFWITQRRCEKTLQHLPAAAHERLPILYHPDHPMSKISRHRMFVKFHRHPTVILVCVCMCIILNRLYDIVCIMNVLHFRSLHSKRKKVRRVR